MICEDGEVSKKDKEIMYADVKEALWKAISLPLEEVHPNYRSVINGSEGYGKLVYKLFRITRFCAVVLWADKDWETMCRNNQPVSPPEDIHNVQFDCVFGAVSDPVVAASICESLIENGVAKDNIISTVFTDRRALYCSNPRYQ